MNTTTAKEPKTATTEPLEVAVEGANSVIVAGADDAPKSNRAGTRHSVADLEKKTHHYPEPIRSAVTWLQSYWLMKCHGNNASLRALVAKAGWDKSEEYFYNLLCGFYFRNKTSTWNTGGKAWSEFLEIYEAVKRYAEAAERQGRMHFVETPTYRCISDFITARRALNAVCKIGGITGATGGQKTKCLKHYTTLNNHCTVIRVEAPANARISTLQVKIAEKYNVKGPATLQRFSAREAAIRENVNETRTIIIDNAQRLYIEGKGSDQPCFNWLLELQEDTECTLILSWTTDFTDKLTAGRAKGYFEQFIGRMGGISDVLSLPDYAPASDLRTIARSFGLDPGKGAMDYLHKWSRTDGRIRIVFQKLQRAQEFSRMDGRDRITLADLDEAHTWTPPAIGTDAGGDQ